MLIQIIPAPALDPNLQVLPTETPTITQLEKPSLLCPFGVPKSTESINVIKKVFYASTFWTRCSVATLTGTAISGEEIKSHS